jgi:hypothetical protein
LSNLLDWPVMELSGYQYQIYQEYSALQDYLWKSPSFINTQIDIEREKLDAYFPDEGSEDERHEMARLRSLRSAHEDAKLLGYFPLHVSNANLFLATSFFEKHLLRLVRYLEEDGGSPISEAKGNGISRYFVYLRKNNLEPRELRDEAQCDAAIVLRNALLHASGDLSLSRDAHRLKKIVQDRLYMPKSRRDSGDTMKDDIGRQEVTIKENVLIINHFYSMRATRHYFNFLLDLSEKIPSSRKF